MTNTARTSLARLASPASAAPLSGSRAGTLHAGRDGDFARLLLLVNLAGVSCSGPFSQPLSGGASLGPSGTAAPRASANATMHLPSAAPIIYRSRLAAGQRVSMVADARTLRHSLTQTAALEPSGAVAGSATHERRSIRHAAETIRSRGWNGRNASRSARLSPNCAGASRLGVFSQRRA